MEYIRRQLTEDMGSQLMENMYCDGQTSTELTPQQKETIIEIIRPQLQEDVYRGLTGREPLPQTGPVFPLREMD